MTSSHYTRRNQREFWKFVFPEHLIVVLYSMKFLQHEGKAWKFIFRALDKFDRATFATEVGDVPIAGRLVFADA